MSGAMLEHALISGILSQGGYVMCLGEVPTPAVAYLTRVWKGGVGLVTSGRHRGFTGQIKEIAQGTATRKSLTTVGDLQTLSDYVFVIGEKEPEITV